MIKDMKNRKELRVREALKDELTARSYKLSERVRLEDTDVEFDLLAESPNCRTIFIFEVVEEDDIANKLNEVDIKLETLMQTFAALNQERELFAIVMIFAMHEHVIAELENYRFRDDLFHRIVINCNEIDFSESSSEIYLKSVLPLALLDEMVTTPFKALSASKFLESFARDYPIVEPILKTREEENSVVEMLIGKLMEKNSS